MLGVGDLCILSPKRNVWDEHAPDFWPAPFIPGAGRKLPTPTQAIATSNPLVAPTPNVVPLPPVEPTAQETADGAAALRVEATAFVPVGVLETTSQNVEGRFNMTPSLKQEQITIAMPLQPSAGSKVARSGGEATPAGQMAAPSEPEVADTVTALVNEALESVSGLIGDEGAAAPEYRRRRGKRGGINHRRRRARQRAAGGQA